jgi:hypothetical protein
VCKDNLTITEIKLRWAKTKLRSKAIKESLLICKELKPFKMIMKSLFLKNLEMTGKVCLMMISNMKSTNNYMMIILKGKKISAEMTMTFMVSKMRLSMIKNTIQAKSEAANKSQFVLWIKNTSILST